MATYSDYAPFLLMGMGLVFGVGESKGLGGISIVVASASAVDIEKHGIFIHLA